MIFFRRNEIPTIKKVTAAVNKELSENDNFSNISETTVRRLMVNVGFVYNKLVPNIWIEKSGHPKLALEQRHSLRGKPH